MHSCLAMVLAGPVALILFFMFLPALAGLGDASFLISFILAVIAFFWIATRLASGKVATLNHQSPVSSTSHAATTPQLTTEEWLGRHGLSYLGITLLVVGVSFLVAYSLPLLNPWGRILVGLGAGSVLLTLSYFMKTRSPLFEQLFFAGGVGTLYFTTYAMSNYDSSRILTGPGAHDLNTLLLFVVSLASTAYVYRRYRTEGATLLSYLLIYLTIYLHAPEYNSLDTYTLTALLLATAGVAFLSWQKQWKVALLVGTIVSYASYWLLSLNLDPTGIEYARQFLPADTVFLTAFFLLFSLPLLDASKKTLRTAFTSIHLTNTTLYALLLGPSLNRTHTDGWAWLLIGLAAAHYLYGFLLRHSTERSLRQTCFALANISFAAAIPLFVTDTTLTWSWLFLGAAMTLVGLTNRYREFTWVGMIAFSLAIVQFFLNNLLDPTVIEGASITVRTLIGSSAALLALALSYADKKQTVQEPSLQVSLNALALGVFAALASVEFDGAAISLIWGILGTLALIVGMFWKNAQLRLPALLLIGATAVRIFLIDLSAADTVIRVITFIVLGIVLLGASWLYHQQQKHEGNQ